MASVCTVCIAASSGTVVPHSVAALPVGTSVSTVSPRYALAASSTSLSAPTPTVLLDALNVASLPLQNLITVLTALGGVTGIVILPNTVYSLAVSGKADQIPQAIQDAITKEAAAFQTLLQVPQTIIDTNVAAVKELFSNFGGASSLASVSSTEVATTSSQTANIIPQATVAFDRQQVLLDALNVASLPLQNLITTLTVVGGLTGILILPNTVYSLAVSGKSDQIPQAIQDAITKEAAAFQTFVKLPQTIIATDVAAIQKLFSNFGGGAASSNVIESSTFNRLALDRGTTPAPSDEVSSRTTASPAGDADEDAPPADPAQKTRRLPVRHLLEDAAARPSQGTEGKNGTTPTSSGQADGSATDTSGSTSAPSPNGDSSSNGTTASTGTSTDTGGGYVGRHRLKLRHAPGAHGPSAASTSAGDTSPGSRAGTSSAPSSSSSSSSSGAEHATSNGPAQ